VSKAVVDAVGVPVIGCGAGPDCHGFVVVTHDTVNLTDRPPKFAPRIGDLRRPMVECFAEYARLVRDGRYPEAAHLYEMPPDQRAAFTRVPSTNMMKRTRTVP
jgi:3-methyl-2-oxobutanoate hydroxymethyltransferase